MDTEVVVALITSTVSIAIAAGTAVWVRFQSRDLELLKHDLERRTRDEVARAERAKQFESYRRPLLSAASDLRHRLDNVRTQRFLTYLRGPRHDAAIHTTLYRLARYFGVLEVIYGKVNYLEFEDAADTAAVAALLDEIGRTFATDQLDHDTASNTSRFMVWREEQRAMGESVVRKTRDGDWELLGYAEFVNRLGKGASAPFRQFADDMENGDMAASDRVRLLEELLSRLVRHLDTEGRYRSGDASA